MPKPIQDLHKHALEISARYRSCEADLIEVLIELDRGRRYLELGARSLYHYATEQLKLSEDVACNLIRVARSALGVPALQEKIRSGAITLSKARKIAPVLTRANQDSWLELAQTRSQKQVEKAVASVRPEEAVTERMTYKSATRLELRLGISEAFSEKLKLARELHSKTAAASIEQLLEAAVDLYLDRNDPVRKAERSVSRRMKSAPAKTEQSAIEAEVPAPMPVQADSPDAVRTPSADPRPQRARLPAQTIHRIAIRDQGRCTYLDTHGRRCQETRWLHVHHIQPHALGGNDEPENLVTLCSYHHRAQHLQLHR